MQIGLVKTNISTRLKTKYLLNTELSFVTMFSLLKAKNVIHAMARESIITTVANELLQKIGHHRMPVILKSEHEREWLNPNTELTNITRLLEPYDYSLMNAYPISPDIKNPRNNSKDLLQPIGDLVISEKIEEVKNEDYNRKKARVPLGEYVNE